MTTSLNEIHVRTPADLHEMWRLIMGTGGTAQRSLWLALLDEEGRPEPVIVPIDDVPMHPDEMLAGLREVLTDIRRFGEPVALLARPGGPGMTDADRGWARALTRLTRWPVHLYTAAGVRVFAPDDLVTGSPG